MKLLPLKERKEIAEKKKLSGAYAQIQAIVDELRKRELPEELVQYINEEIERLNAVGNEKKPLKKAIKEAQDKIVSMTEKKMQIVPVHYYRNHWLMMGLAGIGVPVGIVLGLLFHDMTFIGFGLPIGLVVGIIQGYRQDKKAAEEGRQLPIELKY